MGVPLFWGTPFPVEPEVPDTLGTLGFVIVTPFWGVSFPPEEVGSATLGVEGLPMVAPLWGTSLFSCCTGEGLFSGVSFTGFLFGVVGVLPD